MQQVELWVSKLSGKNIRLYYRSVPDYPSWQKVLQQFPRFSFHLLPRRKWIIIFKLLSIRQAGAYGVQEWIGFIGVESIQGSYFNVMGLPIQRLYRELKPSNK